MTPEIRVQVYILSSKNPHLNGIAENISNVNLTGRWKLITTENGKEKSTTELYVEITYTEDVWTKRPWPERFREDFWSNLESIEEQKTAWISEDLIQTIQAFVFTPKKKAKNDKPKAKSNELELIDGKN